MLFGMIFLKVWGLPASENGDPLNLSLDASFFRNIMENPIVRNRCRKLRILVGVADLREFHGRGREMGARGKRKKTDLSIWMTGAKLLNGLGMGGMIYNWLVVWLPWILFSHILGCCHHPNWLTQLIFFRGVALAHQPDNIYW